METFDSNVRSNVVLWDRYENPLVFRDNVTPTNPSGLLVGGLGPLGQYLAARVSGSGHYGNVLHTSSGAEMSVYPNTDLAANINAYLMAGQDQSTPTKKSQFLQMLYDAADEIYRLQTEARLAPGSQVNIGTGIPNNPADLIIEFLEDAGSSEDMLVNGSVTPIEFTFGPTGSDVYAIQELLLVYAADDFEFDGVSFGPNPALTNGIKVEADVDGVVTELVPNQIRQNEDFLRLPGRPPIVNNTGPKDILAASFGFGGLVKLDGATSDELVVTVQDNLTSVKFKYLTGTVFAAKES